MKSFVDLMLEGKSLERKLQKEFPDIIFRLSKPMEPYDNENGWYILSMIVVPYKLREKGLGTKFMKRLIELAKKEKMDIHLTPSAEYQEANGMNKKQITKWYESLGFKKKRKDDFRTMHTHVFYA